jgi:hypothetical protein
VNIVLIVNGICILANVIITNPTYANLVLRVVFSQGVVATIAAQAKVVSYHDQYLEDDFIPLKVKIFGCLHQ